MNEIPTIECSPDGPYVVRNLESLRNSRGDRIPVKAVVALCRCGESASKPFCDGTHTKNGFSSVKRVDRSAYKRDDYKGQRITIHDNRAICAHARDCTDSLAAVFKYGSQPWIDPDGAAIDAIIDTIRRCPSGALSYSLDGVEQQAMAREPAITVTKDGPYAVVGGVGLIGQRWGQGASTEHYTLCRCGASKNKPFCDGRHRSTGFKDERN
jgi:CDGSH-type Zn-finger protein